MSSLVSQVKAYIPSRHPLKSQKVLRKKRQVDPQESQDKVGPVGIPDKSEHHRSSENNPQKNGKNSPHGEYVVEMSYHIVGVMESQI